MQTQISAFKFWKNILLQTNVKQNNLLKFHFFSLHVKKKFVKMSLSITM